MRIVGAVVCVVGLMLLFSHIVGFSLVELASELGIEVDSSQLIRVFIVSIVLVTVVLLVMSYLSVGRRSLVVSENSIEVDGRPVPMDNIARVNCTDTGLADNLFGKGTIIFELTGVDKQKIDMDFVDMPKDVTRRIQELLNTYRMKKYAGFAERQRIERVVENF